MTVVIVGAVTGLMAAEVLPLAETGGSARMAPGNAAAVVIAAAVVMDVYQMVVVVSDSLAVLVVVEAVRLLTAMVRNALIFVAATILTNTNTNINININIKKGLLNSKYHYYY